MRIFILTDKAERHYYFANRIIEETGSVVGVITGAKRVVKEAPMAKKILQSISKGTFLIAIRNAVYNRLFRQSFTRLFTEKAQEEEAAFHGSGTHFHTAHSSLLVARVEDHPVRSVNDDYFIRLIREKNPDIIVVMGTCLLQQGILSAAPLVLNIHTGLSPYYRGGYTNFWPVIEDDYGYFGVTIHRMSAGIDSGDIVSTARPDVFPDDNYGRINSRAIILGTTLMIQALKDAKNSSLHSMPQWTAGKLYHNRDMNGLMAWRYHKKISSYISTYCQRAQAGTLDAVQLIQNGRPVLSS